MLVPVTGILQRRFRSKAPGNARAAAAPRERVNARIVRNRHHQGLFLRVAMGMACNHFARASTGNHSYILARLRRPHHPDVVFYIAPLICHDGRFHPDVAMRNVFGVAAADANVANRQAACYISSDE